VPDEASESHGHRFWTVAFAGEPVADDATANRIERRTYEVTGCRGAWVIDRAAVERLV
jgi:hypothetical protein